MRHNRRSKGRDMRYPELSHTRQVERSAPKRHTHNREQARHTVERARAWRHIARLAAAHHLSLDTIGTWMSTPHEWAVLKARFINRPMATYAQLGRRRGTTIEAVDKMEASGLLRLLTRLIAYDEGGRGEPDGWNSSYVVRWD